MLRRGEYDESVDSYSTISEGVARRRAQTVIRSTQRGISRLAERANTRTRLTAQSFRIAQVKAKAARQQESVSALTSKYGGRKGSRSRGRKSHLPPPPEVANMDFAAALEELKKKVVDSKDDKRYDRHRMGGGGSGGKGGRAVEPLEFGVGRQGVVAVGTWAYFSFELDEVVEARIVVRAVSGNSDLYVSTTTMHPNPQDFTWRSCREGTDFVVLRPEDPAVIEGTYYVGVFGQSGATSKSPNVSFYVSVTKSKEVATSHRLSTAERLLAKQGYEHDPEGVQQLRDRVAATKWRRRQARTKGTDFVHRNAALACTTPLRERPGKARFRQAGGDMSLPRRARTALASSSSLPVHDHMSFSLPRESVSASGSASTALMQTSSSSTQQQSGFLRSGGGNFGNSAVLDRSTTSFRVSRARSEPIFKVNDARTNPSLYVCPTLLSLAFGKRMHRHELARRVCCLLRAPVVCSLLLAWCSLVVFVWVGFVHAAMWEHRTMIVPGSPR